MVFIVYISEDVLLASFFAFALPPCHILAVVASGDGVVSFVGQL